jgi:predicted metal-dependent phosphoesterase TrpH
MPMVSIWISMRNVDLHMHSTVSDGLLRPADLVALAARGGVDVLALTDHDDVAGLPEARAAALESGLRLIPGVEISVTWDRITVHIVGLGIDPHNPALQAGLGTVRAGRVERARRISDSLAAAGIPGAFDGALAHASASQMIGRTHFARFLAASGKARNVPAVFKRFLVRGKPGYVPHQWAGLANAVGWIRAAGGIAVLAHPGRYALGSEGMRKLLQDFRECGGGAIEVVTSNHTRDQIARFARLADAYGLLASRGSDYHGPGESFISPGKLPPLPAGCRPVWQALV